MILLLMSVKEVFNGKMAESIIEFLNGLYTHMNVLCKHILRNRPCKQCLSKSKVYFLLRSWSDENQLIVRMNQADAIVKTERRQFVSGVQPNLHPKTLVNARGRAVINCVALSTIIVNCYVTTAKHGLQILSVLQPHSRLNPFGVKMFTIAKKAKLRYIIESSILS